MQYEISNFSGVSLVAYYGKKSNKLSQLIIKLQQLLSDRFKDAFIPYQLPQVHATIIGCEGQLTETGIVNKWFYQNSSQVKYIDYPRLLSYLQHNTFLPLNIYFGGYKIEKDYQFLSRNQHPAIRSFQLQNTSSKILIPMLIGWAMENNIITTKIDKLRRNFQQYNCLHKYHKSPQDIDNDVYLRLGTIINDIEPQSLQIIEGEIIDYLSKMPHQIIPLSQNNLTFAKYQDLSLPTTTTQHYSLLELQSDRELIRQLYR